MMPDDDSLASDRMEWFAIAARALDRAYGSNEPKYTDADLIDDQPADPEPNRV